MRRSQQSGPSNSGTDQDNWRNGRNNNRGRFGNRGSKHPDNKRQRLDEDPSRTARGRFPNNAGPNHRKQEEPQEGAANKPRRGPRPPRKMGFRALEELIAIQDTEQLMLDMQNTQKGFPILLDEDVKGDFCVLIVRLFDRVFQGLNNMSIVKLLSKSKFLTTLNNYIKNIEDQDPQEKKFNSKFWENPDQFWSEVLSMCKNLFQLAPNLTLEAVQKLLKTVKKSIPRINEEHSVMASDLVIATAESLFEAVDKQKQEFAVKEVERQNQDPKERTEEYIAPNDDYRELEIYPNCEEITTTKRFFFLNKNRIVGKYGSVNEYLDVQFRLLREDFVTPLREAVCKYLSKSEERITEVRFYKNVTFLNSECVNNEHCYRIQFISLEKQKKRTKINYEHSKRFMFGSLVCFTKNDFRTMIFGKVVQRELKDLEAGQIIVGILNNAQIDFKDSYLMLECNIYFEPYYQVLGVLQKMSVDHFPMQRYIIDVETDTRPPEYLLAIDPVFYSIEGHRFWALNFPDVNFYGLNESQQKAFKAALTQELAIIQGPPGTGKTFVGLKIAQTLLKNPVWYKRSPILLICFTNHALDQFLEGIMEFTDQIVRVGGQSKNEKLDKFNIRKKQPAVRDRNLWDKRDILKNIVGNLESINAQLRDVNQYDRIVDFAYLEPFMQDHPAVKWFMDASKNTLISWLLEGKTSHVQPFQNIDVAQIQQNTPEPDLAEKLEPDENQYQEDILDDTRKIEIEYAPMIVLDNVRKELFGLYKKLENLRQTTAHNMTEELYNTQLELEYNLQDTQHDLNYLTYIFDRASKVPHKEKPLDAYVYRDPTVMPINLRWELYFYWLEMYKENLLKRKNQLAESFRDKYEDYEEVRNINDVQIMKEQLVVGMTTTGAARMNSALRALKCPIVIVEEAAEVLEAHIISALTVHCQHLILIGDHQQLQPSTADFKIENHFNLGVSLFERMILNKVQYHTLNVQHRMRPEISSLIKPHIYPNLVDHESVKNRQQIKGVNKCLYFIDHQHPEFEDQDGTSKRNEHEAAYLIALARYLILNGYEPKQITILAAYLGQMFEMMKLKKRDGVFLAGVRIAVLDNYQGEESDIILLSLVRNNDKNAIGFLRRENRVCVALSRARDGFYMMGNMKLLSSNSELWTKIKETLVGQDALGEALTFKCQIHPDKLTAIKTIQDFDLVAEGGCNLPCDFNLICGHKCKSLCHVKDPDHLEFKCVELCRKSLCENDESHLCRKLCYQDCGPCTYKVIRELKCGHETKLECHMDPELYNCLVAVSTELPCGHIADKACSLDVAHFKCPHPCEIRIEPCGHKCNRNCHVQSDPDHLEYKCRAQCKKRRKGCTSDTEDAAHFCKKLCFEECEPCVVEVLKKRTTCVHHEKVSCLLDVDATECRKPCKKELECGHKCKKQCKDPCGPCTEKVEKIVPDCNHKIKVECHVEASRLFCRNKCPRILSCGHKCKGKCNEECGLKKCVEMVDSNILSECGHIITKLPCWIKTEVDSGATHGIKLYEYCNKKCDAQLKCGHQCPGNCGACNQGRIHVKCAEKCSKIFLCNHECPIPCNSICKPCQKNCVFRCKHSKCPRKCGQVCVPCAEPCERECIHQKCTRKCSDICNVPPCTEPCSKKLKCGHDCVGLCSDTCPPLCRICDKEELTEVFLGDEDEPDARFVYLEDCKHTIIHQGLENWFKIDTENQNEESQEINLKSCPKCKTNVIRTHRYSDYLKRTLIDIEKVKQKACGNPDENNAICLELINKLTQIPVSTTIKELNEFQENLRNSLKPSHNQRRQNLFAIELNAVRAKVEILQHIYKCYKYLRLSTESFRTQVRLILKPLTGKDDRISDQEREDIHLELMRLKRIGEYEKIHSSGRRISELDEELKKLIFANSRYSGDIDKVIEQKLKELNEKLKTGLNISESERIEIVRAMGMTSGHWFKCPNGHIYCITECGGAMQEGNCNECGARIGGGSHRLRSDNTLAREMDGARHPAWSEMNNLANFDNL